MASPATLSGAAALSPGHRLGRYEILAKLAAGGMAIVYVARAHGAGGFERLVALKVLHANLAYEDEFIKMFLDEARLAARIRHPNVVPTIDISDTVQTGFFLVMDYIEGDHLGALLSGAHKAGARLPVGVALRILVDGLSGLGAAHDLQDESGRPLNLVHRDVSPHNIMVGLDGVARLTDFGVAKAEDRLTHTRDGQVKGKLAYMAPEQASTGRSDARSDLFSAGIILGECLTGRRLFRAESTAATLHKLMHGEIAPPSMVDPVLAPLDGVLARALARDPAMRFATSAEFADAIEEAAPAVGGLASSRTVSKAVAEFAQTRITRDRKLIEDAKGKLGKRKDPFEADSISEPSSADLSFSSSSLSFSKLSGVYSSGSATAVNSLGPATPPPALGSFDPTALPPMPSARPPTGSPMPRLLLIVALLASALLAYFWWQQQPAGTVVEGTPESGQPPSAATQRAPPPAPAEAAAQVAASPAPVEATAAPVAPPADPAAATPSPQEKPVAAQKARSKRPRAAKRPPKRPTIELIDNPYRQ